MTRESGSVVGNALKTIYSRITTNDSAISALKAIGISIEDASGQAKSATQIIDEVAENWDKLSESQQRNTAKIMAFMVAIPYLNFPKQGNSNRVMSRTILC